MKLVAINDNNRSNVTFIPIHRPLSQNPACPECHGEPIIREFANSQGHFLLAEICTLCLGHGSEA